MIISLSALARMLFNYDCEMIITPCKSGGPPIARIHDKENKNRIYYDLSTHRVMNFEYAKDWKRIVDKQITNENQSGRSSDLDNIPSSTDGKVIMY